MSRQHNSDGKTSPILHSEERKAKDHWKAYTNSREIFSCRRCYERHFYVFPPFHMATRRCWEVFHSFNIRRFCSRAAYLYNRKIRLFWIDALRFHNLSADKNFDTGLAVHASHPVSRCLNRLLRILLEPFRPLIL